MALEGMQVGDAAELSMLKQEIEELRMLVEMLADQVLGLDEGPPMDQMGGPPMGPPMDPMGAPPGPPMGGPPMPPPEDPMMRR